MVAAGGASVSASQRVAGATAIAAATGSGPVGSARAEALLPAVREVPGLGGSAPKEAAAAAAAAFCRALLLRAVEVYLPQGRVCQDVSWAVPECNVGFTFRILGIATSAPQCCELRLLRSRAHSRPAGSALQDSGSQPARTCVRLYR